jgi:RND superfamily putative drug exporter
MGAADSVTRPTLGVNMKSLARFSVRRRWIVLVFWVVAFVGFNMVSQSLGSAYSNSFSLPGSDSTRGLALLEKAFPSTSGDVDHIVYHALNGQTIAQEKAAVEANLAKVGGEPTVGTVVSPFTPGTHQISADGTIAYATVYFTKSGFTLKPAQVAAVMTTAAAVSSKSLTVDFGGNAFGQSGAKSGSTNEVYGLLATLVILLLAFGSLLAALLPLGVALFAIGIATAVTVLLSHGINIADFAPILGSLIGLGVGIDYALFIVTRTRQEIKKGATYEEAIVTAMNTSGRAVMFAGSTVVVALLGMLILRLGFLNGVAISASLTVLITMVASLTLLPALLGFQKNRVLSRRERKALQTAGATGDIESPRWHNWAKTVAKHPRVLSLLAILVMAAVTIPYFSLHLGNADQGTNPATSTTRHAYDLLSEGFGAGFNGDLSVVAAINTTADLNTMQSLDASLKGQADVFAVSPVQLSQDHSVAIISVVAKSSPQDTRTTDLIDSIRSKYIPAVNMSNTQINVTGTTAIYQDFSTTLSSKIPGFIGIIVLLGSLLLMVAFRSIIIPLVAALMNLLAAAAAFGVVVAVFQWGWGASILGAGTGPVEPFLPVIMIAILFGLSMDYQVFLVSRMHEEWIHTNDNQLAIERGQANTGRIITAAALIMISVFVSFAFGGQRVIDEFGIGLGGAVLLDAFVIRTVLVPALMHYIGKANWFMPKWLDKVVPHVAVDAAS